MQLKFSGLAWLPFLVYTAIPKNYQKIAFMRWLQQERDRLHWNCLLYTSDAADE